MRGGDWFCVAIGLCTKRSLHAFLDFPTHSGPKAAIECMAPVSVVAQKKRPAMGCVSSQPEGSRSKGEPGQAITLKYEIGPVIGSGNFGVVNVCQNVFTQDICAVKIVAKSKQCSTDDMRREVELHRAAQTCSKYIVQIYDTYEDPKCTALVCPRDCPHHIF